MSKIVGIGACVADTVVTLKTFPAEDTKMRAEDVKTCGGGPCGTGIVAASKLGADCAYIGNLSDDGGGSFLLGDFEKYGVSTEYITVIPSARSFISQIWLNLERSSRTIVFDKGTLPALELSDKQRAAIKSSDLLMVDGNELDAATEAAKLARENGIDVLYDAGGRYENVERLLPYANILIPSCEFALGITGCDYPQDAAKILFEKYSPDVVVITTGKEGGVFYDGKEIKHYPAIPARVVDSNGAGDVFHGAYAFAYTHGYSAYDCCLFASATSALKCTGTGARESVPKYDDVIALLEKNGIKIAPVNK